LNVLSAIPWDDSTEKRGSCGQHSSSQVFDRFAPAYSSTAAVRVTRRVICRGSRRGNKEVLASHYLIKLPAPEHRRPIACRWRLCLTTAGRGRVVFGLLARFFISSRSDYNSSSPLHNTTLHCTALLQYSTLHYQVPLLTRTSSMETQK
jgi:hypothetical protein